LARTTTKKTAISVALIATANVFGTNQIIESQPPKKKAEPRNESENILPYSAKKNRAKAIDEYSLL